jgi:hypothetical protein
MKTNETQSKTKTFQKGDNYGELIEWIMAQIKTHDYQPEGTDWSGGEPSPHDPVCELMFKYKITINQL